MKNAFMLTLLCTSLLFTSCAKHIIVNLQSSSDSTGSIVITPTAPIQGSVLTINDKLLVDKKFIKKITVKNVPIGTHNVHFSADSWSYKEKIEEKTTVTVKQNQEVAKIITRPPFSTGYYVVYGKTSFFNTEGKKAQELNWANNILLERTAFNTTGKAIPQAIRYKSVIVYPETYMDGGIDTWGIAQTLKNLFIADEFYLLPPASSDADKLTLHCHIHHTLISGNFTHDLTITLKNSANETVDSKSVTSGLFRDIGKITYDMMTPKYLLPALDLEDNTVKNTVKTEDKFENNTNIAPKPTIAQPKVAKASELEYAKKGCSSCSGHGKVNCSKCQGTQKIDCNTCNGSGKMQCHLCDGRGTEKVRERVRIQRPKEVEKSYYDSYSGKYKYRYVTVYVDDYEYRTVDQSCSKCNGNKKINCSDYSCRYGKKTCNAYNCANGLNTCSVCSGSGIVVNYNNLIPKKN